MTAPRRWMELAGRLARGGDDALATMGLAPKAPKASKAPPPLPPFGSFDSFGIASMVAEAGAAPDLAPPTRLPYGWSAADWLAEIEERAAIREHCGGTTRERADALAFGDIVGEMLVAADAELRAELWSRLLTALGLSQGAT